MEEFEKNKIKEFKYWTVFLHENQGYLGRCVVYCRREDAVDLSEASEEEQTELIAILKALKLSIENNFQADWMNYAFLGNRLRHLHGHVIPRYSSVREFEGTVFKDKNWGQNYKTDHSFKISEELLQKIKSRISENL
jgi:diadenosine tetraphosphate (Ap4A) HIT family hydrolase